LISRLDQKSGAKHVETDSIRSPDGAGFLPTLATTYGRNHDPSASPTVWLEASVTCATMRRMPTHHKATRETQRKTLGRSRPADATRATESAREREILEAAIALFRSRGYADTAVEDVAQSVGILKGSLYYYIDSKEDLLFRIVEDVHEGVQAIADAVSGRLDLSPLERLRLYVRQQVAYNARHVAEISVYYHDVDRLTGARLADIKQRRRKSEEWLVSLLKQAQECGELDRNLDTRLAAKCIFAPIVWMYTWFQPGRSLSAAALGDFCAEFILNGLTAGLPPSDRSPFPGNDRSS
jgi:TetR/AcrR family transcriptional regulator, cholesterol catabolism regulator